MTDISRDEGNHSTPNKKVQEKILGSLGNKMRSMIFANSIAEATRDYELKDRLHETKEIKHS